MSATTGMGMMGGGMGAMGGMGMGMSGNLAGMGGRMGGMGGGMGGGMAAGGRMGGMAGGMGAGGGTGAGAGMAAGGGAVEGGASGGGFGGTENLAEKAAKRRLRLGIAEAAVELAIRDTNSKSRVIRNKLEEPIAMPFANETPLEDVIKYIKQASTTGTYSGLPIYVDPVGLADAEKTMTSTVQNLDLEGVPLRITLKLLLKQLGMAYCVRDGVLMISSEKGIGEELEEAQIEIEKKGEIEGEPKAGGDGSKQRGSNLE